MSHPPPRQPFETTQLRLAFPALGWAVAHLVWLHLPFVSQASHLAYGNLALLPAYAFAVVLCWRARPPHPAERRAWRLLALAMVFPGFGYAAYAYEDWYGRSALLEVAASFVALGFVPLTTAGLFTLPMAPFSRLEAAKIGVETATIVVCLGVVMWQTYLGNVVHPVLGEPVALVAALAYPTVDLLLCALLVLVVLRRPTTLAPRAILLVGAGLTLVIAGDVSYATLTAGGDYRSGHPIDALWSWGVTLCGLAAAVPREGAPRVSAQVLRLASRVLGALPYVGVALCFALLLWSAPTHGAVWSGALYGTALVTALALVRQVLTLRENVLLAAQLARQAREDGLTGLPNRVALSAHLDAQLATGASPATLFIDLDRFKQINDTLGHAAGDALLREVAARLRTAVGAGGLAARISGDEFALVLDGAPGEEQAADLAQRTLADIGRPVVYGPHSLFVTASVGVHVGGTGPGAQDSESLIQRADLAMYEAKRAAPHTARFFVPEMQVALDERLTLSQDLHRASLADEFVLHYQPQVTPQGEVVAVEALARWQHPTRGLLSAAHFVPLAEENGRIVALDTWALRTALGHVRSRRDAGSPGLRVAVNVSPLQFVYGNLPDVVEAALREAGVAGDALEVELTESSLLVNLGESAQQLARVRELGVRVALDDFGTGYSSLAYLRQLPVDTLKLDRALVADVEVDATFVRHVTGMAHALGMEVVAEGVERPAQARALSLAGCDLLQGYLYGRAVPAEEFGETRPADRSGRPGWG